MRSQHAIVAALAWVGVACAPAKPTDAPVVATSVDPTPVAPLPTPRREVTYDRIGDPAVFLADDFDKRERRRALLRTAGSLYWDLGSAEDGRASAPARPRDLSDYRYELVVAERHPQHLRVVHDVAGVRVVFYLGIADFFELPRREVTLLQPSGEPFNNSCGVTVQAGTRVKLGSAQGGFRSAEHREDDFWARGALAVDDINPVYEAPPAGTSKRTYDCKLEAPVSLRDGPNGAVVAELVSAKLWDCQRQGAASGGAQKVAVFSEGTQIVGFAPLSAVSETGPAGFLGGGGRGGGGWGVSHATFLYLWPGDVLRTPESGAEVGRVLKRAMRTMEAGANPDGQALVSFPVHPWDFTKFSVDAPTAAAAKLKYAAWLDRLSYSNITVTGGGTVPQVEQELAWARPGIARCYDRALEGRPKTSFRYDVVLDFAAGKPRPKLTAAGATDANLEGCLATWLRDDAAALIGTQARFTVELTPSDLVD